MQHSDNPRCSQVLADHELLEPNEVIAIIDDLPDITEALSLFLKNHGFAAIAVNSAENLRQALREHTIALALLDIGLPDADGVDLLPRLKEESPDTSVIMLTAAASLDTALSCLRQGAEDYLIKPVSFRDLLSILRRVLERRRLTLRNRQYQAQLEEARLRIERTHNRSLMMTSAYMRLTNLDALGEAILTGITAQEGLGFNRAMLFLYDDASGELYGHRGHGPMNREEGFDIWRTIADKGLTLQEMLRELRLKPELEETPFTRMVRRLRIPTNHEGSAILKSIRAGHAIVVSLDYDQIVISPAMRQIFVEGGFTPASEFIAAPLFSSGSIQGAVLVDNIITGQPFPEIDVLALESYLGQASLAIEHGRLYQAVQNKVLELEQVTRELHKNKEMLVTAGRYSALGHMAAQLTHNLQNPITAIGGTARMLCRKSREESQQKFLCMMVDEVEKVENVLLDLSRFTNSIQPVCELVSLGELAMNALRLYQPDMNQQGIQSLCEIPADLPEIEVDPKMIQQGLVHLIANAIDAMPKGGLLRLSIFPGDGGQVLTLDDSGGGISSDILQNVTNPFFTTKTVGTGLGLSLVQRVLGDHGGALRLSNKEGGGVQARIWLPLRQKRRQETAEQTQ